MCQSFWFLSWLRAFLGSSPTLPVCTLTGCQVIFPKHRLDLVSLWLRKLTLPVVWRPQSRPRSLAPAALNLTCRLGSLLTLPRERALGSLISLAASIPFVIFFSSWNALSHFHPLHFFKSPHLILGPVWSPLEILSKWIIHFCSHSPLFLLSLLPVSRVVFVKLWLWWPCHCFILNMKMSKCLLNKGKVCNPPYEEYYYYKVFY